MVWFYPDKSPFDENVLIGEPRQSYVGQPVKVLSATNFGGGTIKILVRSDSAPLGYAFVYPSDIEGGELIGQKKNPAKRDRCVRAVKRSLRKRAARGNAYAICARVNPSPGNPYGAGRMGRFVILARRRHGGSGKLLHYTGVGKFSDHGPVRVYGDWRGAAAAREKLQREYPILARYALMIRALPKSVGNVRRKNPETRADLARAAKALKDFSGHEASEVLRIKERPFKKGLVVGQLHGLLYGTVRDGRSENYIHRFRKSSRPLLAASDDGKSLRIVGGRFQFTEAGIEDR